MTTHTNYQRIFDNNGVPLFVIIPYADYERMAVAQSDETIPNEVVGKRIMEGMTLLQAWREHLGLTQEEVAAKMGITQPGYAQIEAAQKPRKATLQKAADALGITVGQLGGRVSA